MDPFGTISFTQVFFKLQNQLSETVFVSEKSDSRPILGKLELGLYVQRRQMQINLQLWTKFSLTI